VHGLLFCLYGNFYPPKEERAVLQILEVTPHFYSFLFLFFFFSNIEKCLPLCFNGHRGFWKLILPLRIIPSRGCVKIPCLQNSSQHMQINTPPPPPLFLFLQTHESSTIALVPPFGRSYTTGRIYLKAALKEPVLAVLEDDSLNLEIEPFKVFNSLSPAKRTSYGLTSIDPSDGAALAEHPAMRQILGKGGSSQFSTWSFFLFFFSTSTLIFS